jgi:hypothetical protein
MRITRIIRRAAVVVAVAAAFGAVLTPASAAPADDDRAATIDSTQLSPAERERFVQGARTVGGLTDEQIALALSDPKLMAGVPVEAVTGAGDAEGPTLAASGCRDPYARVDMLNAARVRLFRFQMSKYYCWNGTRVTRGDAGVVTVSITTVGTTTGWRYSGISSQFDRYYTYGGNANGGHHSFRQGHFQWCPPRVVCISDKYPYVNIWGHRDGSWDWSSGV